MRAYFADIRGLDAASPRITGRSGRPGSAFASSLLLYAVGEVWGAGELPEIREDEQGKPYFPDRPGWHFSLSHTKTHVLCALSDSPVGADVEALRDFPEKTIARLTDGREREDFDFLELWVLRESLFKLRGGVSLRSTRFRREGGEIVPPVPGVYCRLYRDVPGCVAALCSTRDELPPRLIFVPSANICT